MAPVWHKLAQLVIIAGMFWFLRQMLQKGFATLDTAESDHRAVLGGSEHQPVVGGVLVQEAHSKGQLWPDGHVYFTADLITIGRGKENHVVIEDQFASNLHARIVRQKGRYYLADAGSTNRTYLNGKEVKSSKALADGDLIGLGETLLRFSYKSFEPE